MRISVLVAIALLLLMSTAERAQTYKPPISPPKTDFAGVESDLHTVVERTDSGAVTHLKVTITVPEHNSDMPVYAQVFFYGWISTSDGNKLRVSQCVVGPTCPFGFPSTDGPFKPGHRLTLETDVPKSFVEADGAQLHVGIGSDKAYYPSQNLLDQRQHK
jgi:hypothetical protein